MGISEWCFIRKDDGTVARLPLARYFRFLGRRESLDESVGAEACVVSVFLDLENRRPVRLLRVEFNRHLLDHSRLIDLAHAEAAAREFMTIACGAVSRAFERGNVVDLSPYLARRRVASEHQWEPSPAVLDQLCQEIDQRAGTTIVQRVGRELQLY